MEPKEKSIIKGDFFPEPVEVIKVDKRNGGVVIHGRLIHSGEIRNWFLTEEDLREITTQGTDFSAKGSEAFLATEALRLRYAYLFDPYLAVSVSKIDPLPFQIEAVYEYALKLPQVRFMIADDPGAGKTIMAGLIIKELKLRGLAKRILIVVPGHLKDQWLRELKEKFQENFEVFDRNLLKNSYGSNPLQEKHQVILSMDFAKQEDVINVIASSHWDLVVVDESHKMSAYKYGQKVKRTHRYKLGQILAKNSTHMLFLTATPHRGDPENFQLLLDLLREGFFATTEMIEESIKSGDNPLFIRRLKEDLRDFEGKPLFTKREVKTISFNLSDPEVELYNQLSDYISKQYGRAEQENNKRNVAFALVILQRRFASSLYALLKSLERRKERLQEFLRAGSVEKGEAFLELEELEEVEDSTEDETLEKEREWESVSLAKNIEELRQEIETIKTLIKKTKEIMEREGEKKLRELKRALEEGLKTIEEKGGNRKILIFTESRDTLEYLERKVRDWGYSVCTIHGGMPLEERIKAEKDFRDWADVMIATDAAGEGINLQFCHIMINYDIPWNPNKLEQRMGRIHRYGQQRDVHVFNLVASNTREGKVLEKLFRKLKEIERDLGNKVFDVIGEIFPDKNLYQLIVFAVMQTKSLEEIERELEVKLDKEYLERLRRDVLEEALATRNIDYTRLAENYERAKENRLVPEYVEEWFKRALEKLGGRVRERKDGFLSIEEVPYELRERAKQNRQVVKREYPKATFDKEKAFKNPEVEFISFGHPLLENLIDLILERFKERLLNGAVFEDPSGKLEGFLWLFEGEVRDGTGKTAGKKLFCIYDNGKELSPINLNILWDLVPVDEGAQVPTYNIDEGSKKAEGLFYQLINQYKEEILKERERQARIKQKYGVKSLEMFIYDLGLEINELEERKERGEKNLEGAIARLEERRESYERALEELKNQIHKEKKLTPGASNLLGIFYVRPKYKKGLADEEVERIGMEFAMAYERSQGREPKDVSKENLGYDIRSEGKGEVRYIEVKARSDESYVELTMNEYLKARQLKEKYWLYVLCNAQTSPTLYTINNPAERLKMDKRVVDVRYVVPPEEWKEKGERHEEVH